MKQLLKFEATWCQPCKMMTNIMEGVDFGVEVKKVDIDQEMDLAKQYGIRGVPTLVLTEDGKEVKRTSGVLTEEKIKAWLES